MSRTVAAPHGMVCSIDHLASNAGVSVLQLGGTAVDAAIATSAVLAVTAQHACGMGGDLFALVHTTGGPPAALNASGRSGSGANPVALRAKGHESMPHRGNIAAVPVPGCVDGWLSLHERFGHLELRDVLGPAILYAESGFPAMAGLEAEAAAITHPSPHNEFVGVKAGDIVRRPGIARTLRSLIDGGREAFYQGEFGEALIKLGQGEFTEDDLASDQAEWVAPLGIEVWDHELWTIPPNSQGYLALAGTGIVEGLDLPDDTRDPLWAHLMVEAARAAAHDRIRELHEGANGAELIARARLDERRAAISPNGVADWSNSFGEGGTIHLTVADASGMAVSLIQSVARGFGSYLIAGSTGIFLHNRGIGFSLNPGHPAEYGPGRRPPHTLSPALITRADGSLRAVLGTMGGDAQPHVIQQMATRLLRHGQTPGDVIESGRFVLGPADPSSMFGVWHGRGDVVVKIEPWMEPAWRKGLEERGHRVEVDTVSDHFGHAHCIEVRDDGLLMGQADPRAEASAAAGY